MSDVGKGSAPRPFSVNDETFKKNFDLIFGKHDKNSPSTQRTVAQTDTKNTTKEKGSSSGLEKAA